MAGLDVLGTLILLGMIIAVGGGFVALILKCWHEVFNDFWTHLWH